VGKYIELAPHPVVSGFMSGIGVIIILLQLSSLVGEAAISKPLVGARKSVCEMLEKQRVIRHFNTGHRYHKRIDALLHAKKLLQESQ